MTTDWTAPLSESQLGLLVVHRAVPARHLYNVVVELELDPRHSAGAVRAALADVLAVQPALRMALHEAPDPHATLVEPADPPLTQVVGDPARLGELVDDLATTAFDLDAAPLLRATHLRTPDGDRSVLLIVVHHTVFDGFSLRPLVADLTAALAGELDVPRLRPSRERALHRELTAQRDAAADPSVTADAAALGKRLRDTPATVPYPRPNRPLETDFAGARRRIPLTATESAAVDRTAAALSVTPFAFFSAVYAATLARHTGNDTVTFGAPLLARRTVGSYDLCGFFVNTLPLVLDVAWDRTFAGFLTDTVAAEVAAVRRHAAVPFGRIVQHAEPDRATSRNPLFAAMLAMQDSTDVEPGPVLAMREHGTDTAKFDLWLGATPTADGWLLELEHDTALLPAPVATAFAESLREAVVLAAEEPERLLADLFTDASAAPSRTTDGYRRRPQGRGLDGWLRRTAEVRADNVAVEENGSRLTYRQLVSAVRAAATGLRSLGVQPRQVVGLTTGTLTDTVVAMLAVLRVGARYLPLDLGLPADRVRYQVEKAGCGLVVGDGGPAGVAVATVDELIGPSDPHEPYRPSSAAGYVMFTSGSTGLPKGVAMGEAALLNLTAWQVDALRMDENTRFLQYAPLGFDVSFQEIVPTLAAGGTLVAREPADRRDIPAVVRRVLDTEVTHVYLPVAALRPFVRAAMATGEHFAALTHLCVSGEQLVVDPVIEEFFAAHPEMTLVNLYGPTETHAVTTHRLSSAVPDWPAHVPIGRPITGVTAQVVDRTGHLAPIGVVGELMLGGRCPADGYVNDDERTAERFLPDPYGAHGARRYRTGDQVLWSAEENLIFLGRDDHQVKIRGHRVELGEIEAAALAEPGVRQAVAVARGDGADRHLVLFLQTDDPGVTGRITGRLSEVLPAYMVPARVFAVAALPVTANGKVDRTALLGQVDQLILADRPQRTEPRPADPLAAELLAMWAELLDRDDLTTDGSLLASGAHSLNVLTALAEIETRHGVRVAMLDFFRAPTVDRLAELVRAGRVRS